MQVALMKQQPVEHICPLLPPQESQCTCSVTELACPCATQLYRSHQLEEP